jgi:hypothetical protein
MKIQAKIGWSRNRYCCVADNTVLKGIIIVTNRTIDGIKKEFQESLKFHIAGYAKDGEHLPDWLIAGKYKLEYIMEMSALLHSLDGIITRSSISKVTQINERQLNHYASGRHKPRPEQRQRIIEGIHQINREISALLIEVES